MTKIRVNGICSAARLVATGIYSLELISAAAFRAMPCRAAPVEHNWKTPSRHTRLSPLLVSASTTWAAAFQFSCGLSRRQVFGERPGNSAGWLRPRSR